MKKAILTLNDGTQFAGRQFGWDAPTSGEVVFCTAMTGYVESLTDPSYAGQILVMTYPLIGNYGVPPEEFWESNKIHVKGLIVSDYSEHFSHWNAKESLAEWLKRERIPAITGVDTRRLTKILREQGVMSGIINTEGTEQTEDTETEYSDVNWVEQVSCHDIIEYNNGAGKRVVLVDCGVKENIIRCLVKRGVEVVRVPWNYDYTGMDFDGLFLSNGPGDPRRCQKTVEILRRQMSLSDKPIMGICLGNQLLASAAGADVYKLKYGHRSHNQPVRLIGTNRCFITAQNHGYAVDDKTLPADWQSLFVNMNDGSNEGIRHKEKPWFSAQFHPEACSGPTDTEFLFDEFVNTL